MSASIRRVSVMMPMFNESRHVEQLVRDLVGQDYTGEIEVLVADGRSTDDSVARLERAAALEGLDVTVIDNPHRTVPSGLNRCIAVATGDLLVRLDCHSSFPRDYLRRCAEVAEETGAWNVGGNVLPMGETAMEKAVAAAMDSPFGGIGWTRHTDSGRRVEVDTVTFGAFRPEAFATVGVFDEELVRDQDDEMNLRIRRAGGRIVLDPSITTRYTPRGSWRAVYRQYYEYGFWKVRVMRKHGQVLGTRSMVPVVFVGSLGALALLALPVRAARRLLMAELVAYVTAGVVFGGRSVVRRRESMELLPLVVATYPAFHVGYGVGMAHAVLRLVGASSRKR